MSLANVGILRGTLLAISVAHRKCLVDTNIQNVINTSSKEENQHNRLTFHVGRHYTFD
jgi:hypothetical protein